MYEHNGHIIGILKDITFNITFPFAIEHNKSTVSIYQETLNTIKNAQEEDLLLHLYNNDSSLYDVEIEKILMSYDEESNINSLWYPSTELLYKNTKLIFQDISILTLLKNVNITLNCNLFSYKITLSDLKKDLFIQVPYKLSDITISIECDLEYQYFDRLSELVNPINSNQEIYGQLKSI